MLCGFDPGGSLRPGEVQVEWMEGTPSVRISMYLSCRFDDADVTLNSLSYS
jgi:hypothetical protein